ncbi:MAG: UDP-N-acetylmuramoyl-L-alanine--D-glutamate ligase [Firmicutes bacterium]|nr:UDP-N-acetylmuramoyl-L-alanine--D-glutamate ligase [Bacillota bacterium]
MDLKGRKVIVVGLAKSGIGAADLLVKQGALVTVLDTKDEAVLADNIKMLAPSVALRASAKPEEKDLEEADLLVLSPAVPADLPFVLEAKRLGLPVWSEIELASRFTKAKMIGITGTNGKTTTTSLVGEIMKKVDHQSMTAGNIGISMAETVQTVPDHSFLTLELSSFQLELIDQFHPIVSAILNFTPDHLNRHHTFEAYVEAKCRVYENQTKEDTVILNYDDAICREKGLLLSKREKGPRVVFFSRKEKTPSGIWLEDGFIKAEKDGQIWDIVNVDEMKIFGPHNEENAMAAVGCCLYAGADIRYIQEGLREFPGVAHRIEPVGVIDGVSYYNDSKATNPDAAIKGLLAMRSPMTVLIGGGYDKGTPYDEWTDLFPGRVRKLVLIGQTAETIREAAVRSGYPEEDIVFCETFDEAIKCCRKAAVPGDSVLLSPACASWGMFDNYEQRGDIFRETVRKMKGETNAE